MMLIGRRAIALPVGAKDTPAPSEPRAGRTIQLIERNPPLPTTAGRVLFVLGAAKEPPPPPEPLRAMAVLLVGLVIHQNRFAPGQANFTPLPKAYSWPRALPDRSVGGVTHPGRVVPGVARFTPLPKIDPADLENEQQAALLAAQKTTGGLPAVSLTVGSEDLAAYLLGYEYQEEADKPGELVLYLDNREGVFDDLATDWPTLARGAVVSLARGLVVDGLPITAKLPRCWVEGFEYQHDGDFEGVLVVDCVDWRGLLDSLSYEDYQTWTGTSVQTIVASVLSQAGLSLAAGSFDTSLTIDFEASPHDTLLEVLEDLTDKVEDFLYSGLEGEVLFKTLDSAEAAGYDYGFNADHPYLEGTETAEGSPIYNKIVVKGGASLQYSGSAQNAADIAATGQTRSKYVEDASLSSNAECTTRATAELSFWDARSSAAVIVARPHFSLRMFDVVSVAAPPWGGPDLTAGRVSRLSESYGFGEWEQELELGELPEIEGLGPLPGSRRRRGSRKNGRRSARRRSSRRAKMRRNPKGRRKAKQKLRRKNASRRARRYAARGHHHSSAEVGGAIPVGGIIMWSGGSVPAGWALCDGGNGTPDLRDKFVLGSGGALPAIGGASEYDLRHNHGPGTLATDSDGHTHSVTGSTASDSHSHGPGTLATDSDSHTHGVTGSTASDSHSHGPGTLATGPEDNFDDPYVPQDGTIPGVAEIPMSEHFHDITGSTASDSHSHGSGTLATASDGHSHAVDAGATGSDSHSHGVGTLATDNDSHSHLVASGVTANSLSSTTQILPPYYALAFIMRIS